MPLRELYEASCDKCPEKSGLYEGPKQLAVVRMLRDEWLVRTNGTVSCPSCAGPPSIAVKKP